MGAWVAQSIKRCCVSSDGKRQGHHIHRDRKGGDGCQGPGSWCALGAELQSGEMESSENDRGELAQQCEGT